MKNFKTPKGTELPMLSLKGKDYLQVAHRLVWFREEHPGWQIFTDVHPDFEKQRCVSRAEIRDDKGYPIATATKVEDKAGFSDYVEKSETGAIGRALALCGYGTQFAPELDEEERIVDAPLVRKPSVSTAAIPKLEAKTEKAVSEHDELTPHAQAPNSFEAHANSFGPSVKEWHPGDKERDDVLFMLKEMSIQTSKLREFLNIKFKKNLLSELTRQEYELVLTKINDGFLP